MGKRFAIVIGVAAAGVMALGAQSAAGGQSPTPDLKLSGPKKQGPDTDCDGGRCVPYVNASCGEVSGPPLPPPSHFYRGEYPGPPANFPDFGCTVRAEGKLTKVKNDKLKPSRKIHLPGPVVACGSAPPPLPCNWESGSTASLKLRLSEKTRKQVRNALDDGKIVRAKVTVRAKHAGKVATPKRTIRLVK